MTMTTKKIKLCAFHLMGGSSQERFFCFLLSCMIAVLLVVVASPDANAQFRANRKGIPLCAKLGKQQQGGVGASSGAQMYCFGPQSAVSAATSTISNTSTSKFGSNVDAATFSEDVTPSGVQ